MWRVFGGALVVLVCTVPPMAAQSTFGSIVGVVEDQSHAPVPGASVQIRSLEDNNVRSATSDQNGAFAFPNLQPGNYTLSVQLDGFADFMIPSATLSARQALRLDAHLVLKGVTQTVDVTAGKPLINTENAVLGDAQNNSQITQLPLNGRAATTSPLTALSSSANVVQDSSGNIAVGAATANMVGYSVDGISTTNIFFSKAGANPYPSSEGIADMQVAAFNNSAEFAQVSDVTFTTKAGTNALHWSLFEYNQNAALDNKVYNFNVKAPKQFNTFGGSLGGPVVIPKLYNGHNRTFVFVDYEGNQSTTAQSEQYLVPTLAEREGNLRGLSIPNNTLINPVTGQAFPNNTIPVGQINQTASTLLNKYYPLPNASGNGYNYQNLQPIPSHTNGVDVRIDHILSPTQQIYARYNWKDVVANVVNPLLPNDLNDEHNRSFLMSHNYIITPNLLNEFRFGFTNTLLSPSFPLVGAQAIAQLGLQGVDVSHHPTDGGFPSINFSDGTGFAPIGRDHVGPTFSGTKQITDNITFSKHKHTIRAGVDLRWVRFTVPEIETPSDDYGLFTFNQGVFTGNSFGDFLLGLPNTSYFAVTGPPNDAGALQTGIYAQDEWRVNDRVTLNLGLRWELLPPFVDRRGQQANFDPATNSVIINNNLVANGGPVPAFLQAFNACTLPNRNMSLPCSNVVLNTQAGVAAGLRKLNVYDFDPRVSVAYRPVENGKTVIRAGFGIFTVTNLGQLQNNNESNPTSAVHTYQNTLVGGTPLIQFPDTIAASQAVEFGGGTIQQATAPQYRDPQSFQWNVTLERQLTPNTAVRASYVGMYTRWMNVSVNWNQIPPSATPYTIPPGGWVDPRAPFQNWGVIYETENLGTQHYKAMQLEVNHRVGHGLTFQANYTLAKDVSDAQGDAPTSFAGETNYGLSVVNRFDIKADTGDVAFVPRQRFLLSATYDLPFGQERQWSSSSKVLDATLGGWSATTLTLLQTGPYLTPAISCAFDQTNTDPVLAGSVCRPDIIGDPKANLAPGTSFNVNAFAPTPVGAARVGNAGVGILEGPGEILVNAGLAKTFRLKHARLRFEATFTNVFNHINFAPPATDVGSPSTFGVLQSARTGAAGSRAGQLALRLDF
jgi:hypothetical protein